MHICDLGPQGSIFDIEIYTLSESWILSFPVMYGLLVQYLAEDTTIWKSGIWGCKKKKKNH